MQEDQKRKISRDRKLKRDASMDFNFLLTIHFESNNKKKRRRAKLREIFVLKKYFLSKETDANETPEF